MRKRQAGLTLMEVLVAIALLSLLSVGILMALRVGASAWESANTNLTLDRRIATANKILHSALEDMLSVVAEAGNPPISFTFFQGEPASMRFVTAYSLDAGPRGGLRIFELQVIDGPNGRRVLLNEQPYAGPRSAGRLVTWAGYDPLGGGIRLVFAPIVAQARSFILADELTGCAFSYLTPDQPGQPARWVPAWRLLTQMPAAVSVQLSGRVDSPRLQPVTVTVPVRARVRP